MHNALLTLVSVLLFGWPLSASAHAFGQSFTLPIPLWIYLYGGAAAVALSFVVIGYLARGVTAGPGKVFKLSQFAVVRFLMGRHVRMFLRLASVVLFFAAIVGGLIGSVGNINQNFTIVSFWVILLLGFTYLTVIIGNFWSVVNPWKIIVEWLMKLMGGDHQPPFQYPKWLGYTPALLFYFFFIWLELVGGDIGTHPAYLAVILLNYLMLMYLGAVLFGKDIWFRHAEFFTVFFGLVAKLSPVQVIEGNVYLRSPWKRLTEAGAVPMSLLFFILFMLSSTAFDGFQETRSWWNLYFTISPVSTGSHISANTLGTIVLFLSPVLFFILYFVAVRLMKAITRTGAPTKELLKIFAFSLIPIAVAYNIAHYLALLLIQGQGIIPAISDPLSLGWNLFGTADYTVNVGIIGAVAGWHLQVGFILLGHILAVYVAHLMALKLFANHKQALISQLPILVLMVLYTLMGLWILAQPIAVGS